MSEEKRISAAWAFAGTNQQALDAQKKIRRQVEDRLRKDKGFFYKVLAIHDGWEVFDTESRKAVRVKDLEMDKADLESAEEEVRRLARLLFKAGVQFNSEHPAAGKYAAASCVSNKKLAQDIIEG